MRYLGRTCIAVAILVLTLVLGLYVDLRSEVAEQVRLQRKIITISIGVASTRARRAEQAEALLKEASGAQYLATHQGRNRVMTAASEHGQPRLDAVA